MNGGKVCISVQTYHWHTAGGTCKVIATQIAVATTTAIMTAIQIATTAHQQAQIA